MRHIGRVGNYNRFAWVIALFLHGLNWSIIRRGLLCAWISWSFGREKRFLFFFREMSRLLIFFLIFEGAVLLKELLLWELSVRAKNLEDVFSRFFLKIPSNLGFLYSPVFYECKLQEYLSNFRPEIPITIFVEVHYHWSFLVRDSWLENSDRLLVDWDSRPIDKF